MSNFALVNNADHQDTMIITERGAEYGDAVMHAMIFPFEFRSVQAHYPILFHRAGDGEFYPVALFGFDKGENLFLTEDGWDAAYVPAMIRKEPFLVGFQRQGGGDPARVLSMDLDHPRVNDQRGERLFQPLGGRTPFLEDMSALLENIYHGYEHVKAFVAALQTHGLLEPVSFDVTLRDGSRHQLLGFHTLDEDKLQGLPGDTLAAFAEQGFLMPIFMTLASTPHLGDLIARKNRSLGS